MTIETNMTKNMTKWALSKLESKSVLSGINRLFVKLYFAILLITWSVRNEKFLVSTFLSTGLWDTFSRGTTSGEGRKWGLPCLFLKIQKKCPYFGKNVLIVPIYGLNCKIENPFLRVSSRKNTENFPWGAF